MLWLRQRTLWLVLIASLAFNAGVGMTYGVRAFRDPCPVDQRLVRDPGPGRKDTDPREGRHGQRHHSGRRGERYRGLHDRILRSFNLAPDVEKKLRDSRDKLFEEVGEMREQLAIESEVLADFLAAPEPSREAITDQLRAIECVRVQIQEAVIDHFLEVRAELKPEQRQTFMQMIHKHLVRPGRGHGPGRMLHGLGNHLRGFLGCIHGERFEAGDPPHPDAPPIVDEGT